MDLEIEVVNESKYGQAIVKIDGEIVTDVTRIQFDISAREPAEVILHRFAGKLKLRGTFEDVTGWKDPKSDPVGDVKRIQDAYKKQYEDNPYPDA